MQETKQKIASASAIVLIFTIFARILGFFRDMVIAAFFGAGQATDAYFIALTIPELLRDILVGGALSASFIPVFSTYLARKDEENGYYLASGVINLLFLLLVLFSLLSIIFAPYLVKIIAPGFKGEIFELTVLLTRFLFPAIIFFGLAAIVKDILNSYQHFIVPSFLPAVLNLSVIIAAFVFSDNYGIKGLTFGVLIGAFLQLIIQIPVLIRKKFRYSFVFSFNHPGIKRIVFLWVPLFIGLSINHLNIIVNKIIASTLSRGAITALIFADRLNQVPVGLFGITISTVIFPFLSKEKAKEQTQEFKKILSNGIKMTFYLSFPVTIGYIFLGKPIIRLLFERGAFTPQDTLSTSFALLFYAFGSFALAINYILIRGFHSLQDTKTPVKIGACCIGLNIVLNFILVRFLAQGGLALATSIAAIVQMIILYKILNQKLNGLDTKKIGYSALKIILVSIISVVIGFFFSLLIEKNYPLTLTFKLIQVFGALIIATIFYLGLSKLFHLEEFSDIKQLVINLMKKR